MTDSQGIVIERIFNASCEMVWKAWTDEEMAKKWWGPEGFTAPTMKIDLKVGGKYVFAMHGPAGSQWDKDMYSAGVYKEIVPPSAGSGQAKLVVTDYFSDEEGNMIMPEDAGMESSDFPKESTVTVLFEEVENGKTKLTIMYPRPATEAQFQAMLKSGMKEGWNSSLNKLETSLRDAL